MIFERIKANWISIFILSLILILLLFPILATNAAREGLEIWLFNVFPSLLPFMIIANLLRKFSINFFSKIFSPVMRIFNLPKSAGAAFALSFFSGYPIGAKIISEMHIEGHIDKKSAQNAIGFMNNAGPLFILGAISTMLNSINIAYFLLFINFLSALILGFFLGIFNKNNNIIKKNSNINIKNKPFYEEFIDSAINAMQSMMLIGAFIIIFSILSAIFSKIVLIDGLSYAILSSIIEITKGAYILSQMQISRLIISIMAAIIAFGGLSILFQSSIFIKNANLDIKIYMIHKILHAIIAFALAWIFYN